MDRSKEQPCATKISALKVPSLSSISVILSATDKLIMADNSHNTILLCDQNGNKMASMVLSSFEAGIYGITDMAWTGSDTFAYLIPGAIKMSEIAFIRVKENRMSTRYIIYTDRNSMGFTYQSGFYFVTCAPYFKSPGYVKMIDSEGNLKKTITDMNGKPIFSNYPTKVFVDKTMKILVAEKKRGLKVICINQFNDKPEIATEHQEVTVNDIAVKEDGHVFVATGGKQPGVLLLSPDYNWTYRLISSSAIDNKVPKSVSYNAGSQILAVSFEKSNIIEFFKLSNKTGTKSNDVQIAMS